MLLVKQCFNVETTFSSKFCDRPLLISRININYPSVPACYITESVFLQNRVLFLQFVMGIIERIIGYYTLYVLEANQLLLLMQPAITSAMM